MKKNESRLIRYVALLWVLILIPPTFYFFVGLDWELSRHVNIANHIYCWFKFQMKSWHAKAIRGLSRWRFSFSMSNHIDPPNCDHVNIIELQQCLHFECRVRSYCDTRLFSIHFEMPNSPYTNWIPIGVQLRIVTTWGPQP